MLRFTKDHEWLRVDGDVVTFGITDYAQEKLGDVVFVELPKVGSTVTQGAPIAIVESVKAASEVYAPVSGEVIETNSAIVDNPKLVNDAPMGQAWFAKLKLADSSQIDALMDEQSYRATLGQG
jgi:glycine cleavage system H protein